MDFRKFANTKINQSLTVTQLDKQTDLQFFYFRTQKSVKNIQAAL